MGGPIKQLRAISNTTSVLMGSCRLEMKETAWFDTRRACSLQASVCSGLFADTGLSSSRDKAATKDFEKDLQLSNLVGSSVVVTGVFRRRLTRREVVAALSGYGVNVVQSVTQTVSHLIVAEEASRHWAKPNAGTKLLKADILRQKTGHPKLVSENLLLKLL